MRAGHNAHYVVGRAGLAVLPAIAWKFHLARNGAPKGTILELFSVISWQPSSRSSCRME
jgi:hypothetical protein